MGSQVKTRQSQSYKFQEFAKTSKFSIMIKTLHATQLLKLFDMMCNYEKDPTSIVENTERTRFCPQTDMVTSIPTFKFVEYDKWLGNRWLSRCKPSRHRWHNPRHQSSWGPPGSYRPQMGPMLAPWTLLSTGCRCDKPRWNQSETSEDKLDIISIFSDMSCRLKMYDHPSAIFM